MGKEGHTLALWMRAASDWFIFSPVILEDVGLVVGRIEMGLMVVWVWKRRVIWDLVKLISEV